LLGPERGSRELDDDHAEDVNDGCRMSPAAKRRRRRIPHTAQPVSAGIA